MGKLQKIFYGFVEIVKKCSIYKVPICLRYELQPDYDTFFGGVFSIILITFFFSVFFNQWLQLLSKTNVSVKTTIIRQQTPPELTMNTNQFMFALGLVGQNINDPNQLRYFDINMIQKKVYKGSSTITVFKLQACTQSHFSSFGAPFIQSFYRQGIQNYYCPPKDFQMSLKGKYTSQQFIYYKISVDPCTGQNCATQQQIQSIFYSGQLFQFSFFYINKLINPSQQDPVTYFLQDKDYIVFSDKIGTHMNLYINDYQISTDQSILPWESNQNAQGFTVNKDDKESWNYQKTQKDSYAKFFLRKSDTKITYERSFRKIDDLLSYIGGLFGLITVIFAVLMEYYSECSMELQLCQQFFDYSNKKQTTTQSKDQLINSATMINNQNSEYKNQELEQQQLEIQPQDFGIFDYFCHIIYKILTKVCNCKIEKWKRMKIYDDSVTQMRYKLDIGKIIQKLAFYDRSISALFTENQLKLLYLQEKFNFKEVIKQRELLQQKRNSIEKLKKTKSIQSQEKKNQEERINQIINEQKQKQADKVRHRIDQFVIGQQFKLHLQQKNIDFQNLPDQIKKALRQLQDNIQKGDIISKRIYDGLQSGLLQAYQKKKSKIGSSPQINSMNNINKNSDGSISLGMLNFLLPSQKNKTNENK